jgi:signal transduction histidine kinase
MTDEPEKASHHDKKLPAPAIEQDYLAKIPSPSLRLWVGLCVILSVFIVFAIHSIRQIRWLEDFQINVVQRNRKASIQLLRLENDANLLGISLRDMTAKQAEYPLSAWQPLFERLQGDMSNALELETQYAVQNRATDYETSALTKEVERFWQAAAGVFNLVQERRQAEARAGIEADLEVRVQVITGTVGSLLRLNDQNQIEAARRVRRVYASFEQSNLALLGILLLLAVLTGLYTLQANRKTFKRLRHLAERLQDQSEHLRKLSWKLIDVQEATLRQVAHDLHDEFGQILTAVGIMLSRAGQKPEKSPASALEDIQNVKNIVEETLQNVRDQSQMFRPAILDDFGLGKTLEWFASQFSRQTGIHVSLQGSAEGVSLPPEEAIHVYRIVQEALSNVARHSGAEEATVKIEESLDELRVEIRDEGQGFVTTSEMDQAGGEGFGLMGMRERAQRLNGNLAIESTPGRGTVVSVRIPLRSFQLESAAQKGR